MPLITLTSDIGNKDYIVGAIKAQLLSHNPESNIVDISHSISPFNYAQAAYICRSAIKNFPDFTFHIILIDLFDSKHGQLLLCFHHNQYLLCADNGLLPMILEEKPEITIAINIENKTAFNTINCAAIMGNVISQINNGTPLQQIGDPDATYILKNHLRPMLGPDWMEGQIIFIDNFENVVVNITQTEFEEQRNGRKFRIIFKRDEEITYISTSYSDVSEGEKLALFNSAGYLEIAINKGNAAGLFGLKGFSEKKGQAAAIMETQLAYQTIRVFFE